MKRISRRVYHNAIVQILNKFGFETKEIALAKLLAIKQAKIMYIDVAGKKIPYLGHNGQKAFFWETHIRPDRLDKIERAANKYRGEPWLAFSYWILDTGVEHKFKTIITIQSKKFGAKFIKTSDYRKHMQNRSPSWSEVDLPRSIVPQVTLDPEQI